MNQLNGTGTIGLPDKKALLLNQSQMLPRRTDAVETKMIANFLKGWRAAVCLLVVLYKLENLSLAVCKGLFHSGIKIP